MLTAARPAVLVVENDAFAAELLCARLRQEGYAPVGPVGTAEEALALAQATPGLAAAVLDIGLDGEPDGVVLAGLLQWRHALPVLFLTALDPGPTRLRALAAGPCAFLRKPADWPVLGDALALACAAPPPPAGPGVVFVRTGAELQRLPLAEVRYFGTTPEYTVAHWGRQQLLLSRPLRELAAELAPLGFVQTHRGYLVNLAFVEALHLEREELRVGGKWLPLGRTYKETVLACLVRWR